MATAVDPFSAAQITRLAHLLDGPTGSELRRDLREARLPVGAESTKWRMLRESFELAQRQSGSANPVLRFVKLALDPARELDAGDLRETRVAVNEVLLLCGLELKSDGRLVPVTASRTADDARARADRLRERLRERGVHPDVLRFCRAELVQRDYFHAVLEASKSVSAKICERTGLDADGAELADQAFTLTEEDALDMLATISMVHRRLDQAAVTPAAPIYAEIRQETS